MLTIVKAIHLSWFVLLCCAEMSLVQGAADHSRDSTDFADDSSPKWRLPRAISGPDGRPSEGVERATLSPDLVSRFQGRERKRQWRILETLIQLNDMMGPRNRTHVAENSGAALSAKEAESIKKSFDEKYEEELNKDPNIRRIMTLFPTCPSPTMAKNKAFRLFFSIISPERTLRTPVINVKSAVLHLARKTSKAVLVNGNLDASHKRKFKGKRVNAADDHETKWKVRIQVYNMPKGEVKKAFKYFELDPRNTTQWVRVNILKVVEEWLKTSRKNLGLQLTIVNGKNETVNPFDVFHHFNCIISRNHVAVTTHPTGDRGQNVEGFNLRSRSRLLVANDSTAAAAAASIPHLQVVMAKAPQSSAKRIVRHLANKMNACTMIPVLMNLSELKGKWKDRIIAPKSFQSNVCKGTCHRCHSSPANITQPLNGSDGDGCCQPIKWKSLKALMFDDQQAIHLSDIPVLTVTKCGCKH